MKPANAFSRHPIQPDPKISDAEPGIGRTKFAWLALINGLSTLRTFVYQFLTNAQHTMLQETVLLVIKDMT